MKLIILTYQEEEIGKVHVTLGSLCLLTAKSFSFQAWIPYLNEVKIVVHVIT